MVLPCRRAISLVELLVALGIVALLLGLTVAGVQHVHAAAARVKCQHNLNQISLALHHHHDAHKAFPAGMRRVNDPYPYLTWLARLLPYIEQSDLWVETQREYQRDSRFYVPPRHSPSARAMPLFVCPSDGRATGVVREGYAVAFTHYLGVSGESSVRSNGVLFTDGTVTLADIRDGTANTVAVGERPPGPDSRWGWWYAGVGQDTFGEGDMILSARPTRTTFRTPTCIPGPYSFGPGVRDNVCDIFHFWSHHPGGAHFAFADGSVRFLRYSADDILPALATRAGGESVRVPD